MRENNSTNPSHSIQYVGALEREQKNCHSLSGAPFL